MGLRGETMKTWRIHDNANLIRKLDLDPINYQQLGPGPGWGPVQVGALMGPYMGPYGSSWTGLGIP